MRDMAALFGICIICGVMTYIRLIHNQAASTSAGELNETDTATGMQTAGGALAAKGVGWWAVLGSNQRPIG